jgi:hypothetical protein
MLHESKFVSCYEDVKWRRMLSSSSDRFTLRKKLSVCKHFGGEKNPMTLLGIEHRVLGYPTYSLFATSTD